MVVNRILRGKITSVLEFSSIRKFRNINFKNLALWHALEPRTPGYNQGKEGKRAITRFLPGFQLHWAVTQTGPRHQDNDTDGAPLAGWPAFRRHSRRRPDPQLVVPQKRGLSTSYQKQSHFSLVSFRKIVSSRPTRQVPKSIHTTLRWGRAPGKPSLAGAGGG